MLWGSGKRQYIPFTIGYKYSYSAKLRKQRLEWWLPWARKRGKWGGFGQGVQSCRYKR